MRVQIAQHLLEAVRNEFGDHDLFCVATGAAHSYALQGRDEEAQVGDGGNRVIHRLHRLGSIQRRDVPAPHIFVTDKQCQSGGRGTAYCYVGCSFLVTACKYLYYRVRISRNP